MITYYLINRDSHSIPSDYLETPRASFFCNEMQYCNAYYMILSKLTSKRQPTLWLYYLCLTGHGNELRLFTGQDTLPTLIISVTCQTLQQFGTDSSPKPPRQQARYCRGYTTYDILEYVREIFLIT